MSIESFINLSAMVFDSDNNKIGAVSEVGKNISINVYDFEVVIIPKGLIASAQGEKVYLKLTLDELRDWWSENKEVYSGVGSSDAAPQVSPEVVSKASSKVFPVTYIADEKEVIPGGARGTIEFKGDKIYFQPYKAEDPSFEISDPTNIQGIGNQAFIMYKASDGSTGKRVFESKAVTDIVLYALSWVKEPLDLNHQEELSERIKVKTDSKKPKDVSMIERFCPDCKVLLDDDAVFCTECGAKVMEDIKCPKCGENIRPDSKFCRICGVKIRRKK